MRACLIYKWSQKDTPAGEWSTRYLSTSNKRDRPPYQKSIDLNVELLLWSKTLPNGNITSRSFWETRTANNPKQKKKRSRICYRDKSTLVFSGLRVKYFQFVCCCVGNRLMLPLRMNTKKWARATARKGGKAKGQPRISLCGVRVTKRSQDASRQGAALNELIELARQLIILFLPLHRVCLCVYNYIGKRRKRKWKRKKIEIGKVSQPPPPFFSHVSALTNDLLVQHTLSIHRSSARANGAGPSLFVSMRAAKAVDSTLSSFRPRFQVLFFLLHSLGRDTHNRRDEHSKFVSFIFGRSNSDRKLIALSVVTEASPVIL